MAGTPVKVVRAGGDGKGKPLSGSLGRPAAVAVESVRAGDLVVARNEKSGKLVAQRVLRTS